MRPQRTRRQRSAYALILVLGLAVVCLSVGVAFLEAHSSVLPEAENRMAASRARYLAESGVEMACHYLMYPPDGVAEDEYWRGKSGLRVDGTSDFVDLAVTRDATIPDIYQVDSFGVAHDIDNDARAKRGVRARVMVPPSKLWQLPYALGVPRSTGIVSVGGESVVIGDIHANGGLLGTGYCNGKVSAGLTALWLGSGPPTSVKSLAGTLEMPPATTSLYTSYKIANVSYTSQLHSDSKLTKPAADALNALPMTGNIGRIIRVPSGMFRIEDNVTLHGTLVVSGNLELGKSIYIRAQDRFPALVVTGNIYPNSNDVTMVVEGAVICGGRIDDDGKKRFQMQVNGAVVAETGISTGGNGGVIRCIWNEELAEFWNLALTAKNTPYTLLDWAEY